MPVATVPARSVAIARGSWMAREQPLMGAAVGVQLWADDRTRGAAAIAAVMAEMQRIDRRYSVRRADSELSLVNAAAAAQAVRVSDECFQLLARAQEFSRLTQGAFDVTRAGTGVTPGQALPIDARAAAHTLQTLVWRQLQLDAMAPSVRFASAGVRVDLGGFARAHALERSIALLRRHGIRHARVAAGADTRLLGDRRGHPWTESACERIDADTARVLLPLADVALSTAGASAGPGRPQGADGPGADQPAPVCCVTVVAADALTAHALSQALLVLGIERGLRLVEQQGAQALIVDGDVQLHASRGLQVMPGAALPDERRASA